MGTDTALAFFRCLTCRANSALAMLEEASTR
jgi:hypothetical protein